MDSSAYLMRQGWQGKGNSLHPSGRGIKKPLSVSRKTNNFGIGKKKVDVHADQWWARAFDAGLEGLKLGTTKVSSDQNTSTNQRLGDLALVKTGAGKWAGLFDGFIKGEGLQGTLTPSQGATHQTILPKAQRQRPPNRSNPKSNPIDESIPLDSGLPESAEPRPDSSRSSPRDGIDTRQASLSSSPSQPTQENNPQARRKTKTVGDQSTNIIDNTSSKKASPNSYLLAEPKRKKRSKHRLKSTFIEGVTEPLTMGGFSSRKAPKEGRRRVKVKS